MFTMWRKVMGVFQNLWSRTTAMDDLKNQRWPTWNRVIPRQINEGVHHTILDLAKNFMGCSVLRNNIILNFSDFFLVSWLNCDFFKFWRHSRNVANLTDSRGLWFNIQTTKWEGWTKAEKYTVKSVCCALFKSAFFICVACVPVNTKNCQHGGSNSFFA